MVLKIFTLLTCLIVFCNCTLQGLFFPSAHIVNAREHLDKPYVILVSIDGYRFDYNKKFGPPHLSTFFKDGVWSKGLIPIFPSKTFPNHYSIVTGLKASHHGIVANVFWDSKRKEVYRPGKASRDGSWYGGEPIWIAASKQGMLSATYFWVGSDANIQNLYPTYYYRYNRGVSNAKRVEQVINWIELPAEKRPHFITLYFNSVDSAGHRYSPDSEQVRKAVLGVDRSLKKLFDGVSATKLPVNIIVVSDHGMETYTKESTLYLGDYISLQGVHMVGEGAHSLLYIENREREKTIYQKLKQVKEIQTYRPEEMPERYGYSKGPRVGDLILSPNPGYYLRRLRPKKNRASKTVKPKGTHGYDPEKSINMNGIFFAKGPNINPLGEIPAFENIHIYPLIMDILGLEIKTPIDGKREVLSKLIRK